MIVRIIPCFTHSKAKDMYSRSSRASMKSVDLYGTGLSGINFNTHTARAV
jgi:hypothetical protein